MRGIGVKVPLIEGEKIRKKLKKEGLLREDLIPKKEKKFILFPVSREIEGFEIVKDDFKLRRKLHSYKDIVKIPEELRRFLPTSYDMVGDIILIKIPKELTSYGKEIGKALLKAHKNVSSVYHAEPVKGEFRIRDLKLLAGEPKTKTLHKEYGAEFEVDLAKVFFSPRLSSERYRIARLVKDGEIVIDMFAGCAPFSIIIAKHANPYLVYAIDINKYAIDLARENVKRNKLLHKIEVIKGDSAKVVNKLAKKGIRVDRIIMNHPFGARNFLKDALSVAKDGTFIHFYCVLREESIHDYIKNLKLIDDRLEVIKINKIKTYAPREFYTCFDIIVTSRRSSAGRAGDL